MELVATGTWLYDGTVRMPVYVVRLDYDFWYEIAAEDDELSPGEVPALNPDGYLYYVLFQEVPAPPIWPDSPGSATVDEAKVFASTKVPGEIAWSEPPS
jgi:hypothetical protein